MAGIERDVFVRKAASAGIDGDAADALFDGLRADGEGQPIQIKRRDFVERARTVGVREDNAARLYKRLRTDRARAERAASWLILPRDWGWVIVCAVLAVPLALLGGFSVYMALSFWWGWVASLLAAGVAVLLSRLRHVGWVWALGLAAMVIGFVGALTLSGWDIDDTLEERWHELPYAFIAWGTVVTCLWAVVLGAAGFLLARGWAARAGAMAMTLVGSFEFAGIVFL